MPPEVIMGLVLQLPLVSVVTWAFLTGKVHSPAEMKRREDEHAAEMLRERNALTGQINDWRGLYLQERTDRIEADRRLSTATGELKEVTARVEELTKEVIRSGRG